MRDALATLALLSLIAAVGCKKDDEDTDDPILIIDDGTGTTGDFEPPPRIYTEMRLLGFVVWDADSSQVVPYSYQGDSRNSRLEFRLYEGDINSEFCIVAINLDGYTMSTEAKGEGYAWGVDMPEGDKPWFETCTNQGFDVADFSPTMEEIAAWGVHLRLYSALDPELEDWLTPDTPPTDFNIDEYTGGNFWVDGGAISTDASSNYWYGYDVEANFDVNPDTANAKLMSSTMLDGNGDLTTGYYVFDQNVFWNFGE